MEETVRPHKANPTKARALRALFIALGCASLALGTVGVFLPVLPTTPFYLLTLFCFARGSVRLHDWFCATKLYHKHLEGFVRNRAMPWKTKLSVMCAATLVMAAGFAVMHRKGVLVGQICLGAVWAAHVVAFVFFVKTQKPEA